MTLVEARVPQAESAIFERVRVRFGQQFCGGKLADVEVAALKPLRHSAVVIALSQDVTEGAAGGQEHVIRRDQHQHGQHDGEVTPLSRTHAK
jgi:hypothetical protein